MANPARGLLNREKETTYKVWQRTLKRVTDLGGNSSIMMRVPDTEEHIIEHHLTLLRSAAKA